MSNATKIDPLESPHLLQGIIYYASQYERAIQEHFHHDDYELVKAADLEDLRQRIDRLSVYDLNTNILIELKPQEADQAFMLVQHLKSNWLTRSIVVIFLLTEHNKSISKTAFKARVSDCYLPDIDFNDVKIRLRYLATYKSLNEQLKDLPKIPFRQYEIPALKRLMDLVASTSALLLLSPLFLLVALLIKLDSKGPVFYTSKRVGTGYKIFNFYKFRSMRVNADREVEALKASANQYGDSAFFKMKNDPRVTKLGSFLRNSSIDELPQLFNVLKGDMSLVGNRPLPLYEAELLTTDEWSTRFLGPAGITGLWQIIKRGKSDMSDRERKKLDNLYTKNFSIWLDIKIILKTLPVLFQKEKV